MALTACTPYTVYPTDAPADAIAAGKAVRVDGGNAVEMALKATVGTGTATLLRWRGEAAGGGKWIPWGADSAGGYVSLDTSKRGGWGHGRWATGEITGGTFAIFVEGGPTISESYLNDGGWNL